MTDKQRNSTTSNVEVLEPNENKNTMPRVGILLTIDTILYQPFSIHTLLLNSRCIYLYVYNKRAKQQHPHKSHMQYTSTVNQAKWLLQDLGVGWLTMSRREKHLRSLCPNNWCEHGVPVMAWARSPCDLGYHEYPNLRWARGPCYKGSRVRMECQGEWARSTRVGEHGVPGWVSTEYLYIPRRPPSRI